MLRVKRGLKKRGSVEYEVKGMTVGFGIADKKAAVINRKKIINRLI